MSILEGTFDLVSQYQIVDYHGFQVPKTTIRSAGAYVLGWGGDG